MIQRNVFFEQNLEDFCHLMITVGKQLDTEKARGAMNIYFTDHVEKYIKSGNIAPRIKFALQNLIDLKNSNWVPRREAKGPKTIKEVHQDAAKAESQKVANITQRKNNNRTNY